MEKPLVLYVSPKGSDGADGSFDAPLLSIQEALDRLKGKNCETAPGEIRLFGGEYRMRESIVVPESNSWLTIRAVPGEKPVLTGCAELPIDHFIPLSQAQGALFSSKERIPASARDHIFVYDLGADGIPAGEILKNGFNWPQAACYPELICDDAVQTLAGWPNDRDLTRADLLGAWDKPERIARYTPEMLAAYRSAKAHGARQGVIARDYFADKCDTPKPSEEIARMQGPALYCRNDELVRHASAWAMEPEGWLCGYFGNNYADDMTRIVDYDPENRLLSLRQPVMYGVADHWIKVRGKNLLCELDAPGEYYIDREKDRSVLYFYPPDGTVDGKRVSLKSFDQPFFRLEGARHVTLLGLTLTAGTGHAVSLSDCRDCEIGQCEIFNFSLDAVRIGRNNGAITSDPTYAISNGGYRNRVIQCRIHDMGGGGVFAAGGDMKSLERGDHLVSGCEFWHLSMLRAYTPAVWLEGVGNTARDNFIHDCPHMVLQIMGNDMLIQRNRIENVCLNASDQGAIYAGRCMNWLGNVITGNIIRGVGAKDNHGAYLDDGMSGAIITWNYFADISGACVFSNSGFGHRIEDNIFVTDKNAVRAWSFPFTQPVSNERVLRARFESMLCPDFNTPENIRTWYAHYEKEYPYLSRLYFPAEEQGHPDDENCVLRPAHARYSRNVIIGGGWLHDGGEGFTRYYDERFGLPLYTAESLSALGLDEKSCVLGADSPLSDAPGFGPSWIKAWNEAMPGKK
ncbi:MAG: right-handed parallel beta-helix repeat-containing protein [Clostridia bacterium]|nr:right-handed parallel beta-helix repeat-containing protein [Clostridia bacterium]